VDIRSGDARKVGAGAFLTEFGACSGGPSCLAEISRVTEKADELFHSWAYWQFKYFHDITTVSGPIEGFYSDDGTLQTAKVAALARTYAPVIGGVPLHMRFDSRSGAFRLRYEPQASGNNNSEIFMHKAMHYPEGYVAHGVNASLRELDSGLEVVGHGGVVDVAVTRAQASSSSGVFVDSDGDTILWQNAEESAEPGFVLRTPSNVTWWKGVIVRSSSGEQLCDIETVNGNHESQCVLSSEHLHELLFDYTIELWKAKIFGIHEKRQTLPGSTFGPLLGRRMTFDWITDVKSTDVLQETPASTEITV